MTDITETNETRNDEATERDSKVAEAAEKTVETLFGIGRLWATHGLGIGRSALVTSARTLSATAELLGDISERFAEEAEETTA